ncbi:MAG TPA: prepilin-type N-terminal cleavage/methylation domain-containing protein [Steroidobacteraceae bacterium]|nr:prepilin-type N-terminal cleavage/methylation domain-containing protein [Steroidobacteraceae bacterium]
MNLRRQGFTLVEMLVALTLVALMSVAMLQAYRFSQRALAQTTRVDAGARDVASAQRLLRRLIEEAYPFEVAQPTTSAVSPLQGAPAQMSLSAPAPARMGGVGLLRYTVQRTPARDLSVTWRLDRNGSAGGERARDETLLDGVQALTIDYLELVERSDGTREPAWRDTWTQRAGLPALVRIRVRFADGDARRWPELIVAPRIMADANCVFDVISQMCRMES